MDESLFRHGSKEDFKRLAVLHNRVGFKTYSSNGPIGYYAKVKAGLDMLYLMKKLGLGIEEGKFGIINAEHIWKNT